MSGKKGSAVSGTQKELGLKAYTNNTLSPKFSSLMLAAYTLLPQHVTSKICTYLPDNHPFGE